jgi:RNA polymerase sigma-70 factor (ECF subfamily)
MVVNPAEVEDQIGPQRARIYHYLLGIVRDAAEAEDLTQETLLRAYDKRSTLDDPAKLVPWLYRIATNVAYDRFRQAAYRHRPRQLVEQTSEALPVSAEIAVDSEPRLDKVMEQREMSTCVQEFIAALPESYRAVILLHDVQGLTNPEIAEMLDLSLATVKIRLHRARKKLRAALDTGCSLASDERGVKTCERKRRES